MLGLNTVSKAGNTIKVVSNNMLMDIDNNKPMEAAPLCGLKDREKKVAMVVSALINTALLVLDNNRP